MKRKVKKIHQGKIEGILTEEMKARAEGKVRKKIIILLLFSCLTEMSLRLELAIKTWTEIWRMRTMLPWNAAEVETRVTTPVQARTSSLKPSHCRSQGRVFSQGQSTRYLV